MTLCSLLMTVRNSAVARGCRGELGCQEAADGAARGLGCHNLLWQAAELPPHSVRIINDVYCNHAAGDRLRRR